MSPSLCGPCPRQYSPTPQGPLVSLWSMWSLLPFCAPVLRQVSQATLPPDDLHLLNPGTRATAVRAHPATPRHHMAARLALERVDLATSNLPLPALPCARASASNAVASSSCCITS
eukprot:12729977-Heterocapsa_arctica.AAC.1